MVHHNSGSFKSNCFLFFLQNVHLITKYLLSEKKMNPFFTCSRSFAPFLHKKAGFCNLFYWLELVIFIYILYNGFCKIHEGSQHTGILPYNCDKCDKVSTSVLNKYSGLKYFQMAVKELNLIHSSKYIGLKRFNINENFRFFLFYLRFVRFDINY